MQYNKFINELRLETKLLELNYYRTIAYNLATLNWYDLRLTPSVFVDALGIGVDTPQRARFDYQGRIRVVMLH